MKTTGQNISATKGSNDAGVSITGHRAQGSEFPVTIVPLFLQNTVMLSRPWLYTTLTRSKHLAILVEQPQALRHAISQCRDKHRYTLLSQRLRELA